MQNRGCEEAKVGNSARDVERTRERNRLAGVDRLSARKLLQVTFDQVRYPQQKTRAFACRFFGPFGKCLLRRIDSKIDIARVTVRHLRVRFARGWFNVVEVFSAHRLDKFAIDKVVDLHRFRAHYFALSAPNVWRSMRTTKTTAIARDVSTSLDITRT